MTKPVGLNRDWQAGVKWDESRVDDLDYWKEQAEIYTRRHARIFFDKYPDESPLGEKFFKYPSPDPEIQEVLDVLLHIDTELGRTWRIKRQHEVEHAKEE